MGAEPFFFNQAKEKNAPATYARITKIFVIICCLRIRQKVRMPRLACFWLSIDLLLLSSKILSNVVLVQMFA